MQKLLNKINMVIAGMSELATVVEGRILEIEVMMDDLRIATLESHWPRLKFTLPPIQWPAGPSRGDLITLPHGWTIRDAMPIEIDESQRLFQSSTIARSSMPHYLYYGDGSTPSVATSPPEPPADPSSDAENTEP